MAVPKKKTSPSRQGMRASGKHVKSVHMASCSNCGSWRHPHHMCTTCGHYKGRKVLTTRWQKHQNAEARKDDTE